MIDLFTLAAAAATPEAEPRLLGLDAEEDGAGLADLVRDSMFDVAAVEVCMAANRRISLM